MLVALLVLLGIEGMAAQPTLAQTDLPARWTIFHLPNIPSDGTWSGWYAKKDSPWPAAYRFRCEAGTVVVNAANMTAQREGFRGAAWDVETDEDTLDKAIASGKAMLNTGFYVGPAQTNVMRVDRPEVCSGDSKGFVFAVYYGD
jgi:hypothetical protein